MAQARARHRRAVTRLRVTGVVVVAGAALAACTSTPASSHIPGKSFHTASVSGYGSVLVDGTGHTVYVLTAGGHNVACTAASGCTQVWPSLPLPSGTAAATAGHGVDAGLLGTTQSGGTTYPTYNGWDLYEYSGDSGAGQSNGEGIASFGGTWYMLNGAGQLVTSSTGVTTTTSGGGGYGY